MYFQLPLSGSQDEIIDFSPALIDTFNSLSRDHPKRTITLTATYVAFNSLSRDHKPVSAVRNDLDSRGDDLSTPSLGITRELSIELANNLELSTPSLGITEPNSGIFRLSAAFCRGSPSHK